MSFQPGEEGPGSRWIPVQGEREAEVRLRTHLEQAVASLAPGFRCAPEDVLGLAVAEESSR